MVKSRRRPLTLYLCLKLIQVLSVVCFLGNIITGIFWKANADRTRDPRIIANALEGLIRSDRIFTIPGVILITGAGIAAAIVGHLPLLRTGWILWSLALFTVSGIAFGIAVAPLQARMSRLMSGKPTAEAADWEEYGRLSRNFDVWAWIALLTPLAVLALMVLKPTLPGL